MNSLYLPIASFNLAHYFASGLIVPAKFISNRNEDLQNDFDSVLLFCKEKYTTETDCALEIVLTKEELNKLTSISDVFFTSELILPITRIKSIYFKNKEQKDKTIWNIEDGAAFIPEELIKIDENSKTVFAGKLSGIKNVILETNEKLEEKISLFDRLMGGFALMQIGGEDWQNYSENYISTLSHFNSIIQKEWKDGGSIGDHEKYGWLIFRKEGHRQFSKYVFSKVNNEILEKYAQNEGINLEKKLGGLIQIDKIKKHSYTYLAAILAIYDTNGRKKIDDFFPFLLKGDFELDRREGISLMFGLNKGYKAFRNKYETEDMNLEIKFRLDSQLEYYTIESIYQYVFNGKLNNSTYEYLDNWCPKKSSEHITDFETYKVLDEKVIIKKKVAIGSSEYFQELYQSISPNNIYTKILHSINSWMPAFFKTDKISEGSQFFENELKEDFEIIIKSIYENVHGHLAESFKGETENIKTELKDLKKRYNELELVNQNLINQIEDLSKEDQSFKKDKFRDLEINKGIIKAEEADNSNGEFAFQEENSNQEQKYFNLKIKERRKELESAGIGYLRNIATNLGVSNSKDFKGNMQGKRELSNKIINLEFPNQD